MNKFITTITILFLIFNFAVSKTIEEENIVIIVNKESAIKNISSKILKIIYLGKKKNYEDISKITNQPNTSVVRATFRSIILDMTLIEEKKYWTNFLISGKGSFTIPVLSNKEMILQFVENNKEALAYIKENDADAKRVKIIKLDEKKPEDKDYPLKYKKKKQQDLY
jgi:ABC-type phosphate transport system substrate-binding protein